MGGRGSPWLIGVLGVVGLSTVACAGVRTASVEDEAGFDARTGAIVMGAGQGPATEFASLLVENGSGYQVAVRLNGQRIGTATRGRSCMRIPQTFGELRLEFVALGMPAHEAPLVFLEESRHWTVELRPGVTIKYDLLSLAPNRASCLAESRP